MAGWVLVPCLVQLRTEVDEIAPDRDRSSDGTIGDQAHQERESDHNDDETGNVPIEDADSKHEVHAIDLDVDLRTPGLTMEQIVQHILARCRSGAERRLRYIIYNRRIWSASTGWAQRVYTGSNPHDHHAHFSASYETAHEASTASWHLEDLVALTDADVQRIVTALRTTDIDPSGTTAYSLAGVLWDMFKRTATIQAQLTALSGKDFVDEAAIGAVVLAGLDPAAIAAAVAAALPADQAKQVADELAGRLAD